MNQREIAALMGSRVVVSGILKRVKEDVEHGFCARWERFGIPERTGWIVGIRYMPTGRFLRSRQVERNVGGYAEDDWAPPEWRQAGKPTPALLVCFWPSEKPVPVPMDAWRKPDPPFFDNPHPSAWGQSANDVARAKAILAAWNTDNPQPRGAKGRFVSLRQKLAEAPR
ncbi:MAG: hypothetical protein KGL39_45915 [Patescibacteria group bacterium]|nr:hypothetical protein [Patescibacteria group bacterium]